jgi:hypothetical protein
MYNLFLKNMSIYIVIYIHTTPLVKYSGVPLPVACGMGDQHVPVATWTLALLAALLHSLLAALLLYLLVSLLHSLLGDQRIPVATWTLALLAALLLYLLVSLLLYLLVSLLHSFLGDQRIPVATWTRPRCWWAGGIYGSPAKDRG